MTTIDGRIVGTWRLVSTKGVDDAARPCRRPTVRRRTAWCASRPAGACIACCATAARNLPSGEPRQFMSYAGNYTFDGTTLSTRVDASSDASRVGGDQVRAVRFENGKMVLAPPRRLYAGVMQHQELAVGARG